MNENTLFLIALQLCSAFTGFVIGMIYGFNYARKRYKAIVDEELKARNIPLQR